MFLLLLLLEFLVILLLFLVELVLLLLVFLVQVSVSCVGRSRALMGLKIFSVAWNGWAWNIVFRTSSLLVISGAWDIVPRTCRLLVTSLGLVRCSRLFGRYDVMAIKFSRSSCGRNWRPAMVCRSP